MPAEEQAGSQVRGGSDRPSSRLALYWTLCTMCIDLMPDSSDLRMDTGFVLNHSTFACKTCIVLPCTRPPMDSGL